jgi:hypothetical protein
MAYPIADVVRYCFISPATSVLGLRWLDRPTFGIHHRPWLLPSSHVAVVGSQPPSGRGLPDASHEVNGGDSVNSFCVTRLSDTEEGDKLNTNFGLLEAFADALAYPRPAGSVSACNSGQLRHKLRTRANDEVPRTNVPARLPGHGMIETPSRFLAGMRR